tara:strand:+ start:440 stop:622 length:183 start_codon:yes stop_codon:yes gene_type:complete
VIKLRNIGSENTIGLKFILFWIFSIQIMYQDVQGGHISFGGCIGPIGISFNLHLYSNLMP